jgi:hypothetical protein
MSKFSNLKENMHRFKTKNLTEQVVQQDANVSPKVKEFLNKNIPAGLVFASREGNDPLVDISIGYTEMPTQTMQLFWERTLKQYRNNKDQGALADLMKTIKTPGVIIRPYNGGESSPYKYQAVGNSNSLKLVKV